MLKKNLTMLTREGGDVVRFCLFKTVTTLMVSWLLKSD